MKATPTNIYLFHVSNRNISKMREICSKLTIKAPERRHCHYTTVLTLHYIFISIYQKLRLTFVKDLQFYDASGIQN